MDNWNSQSGDIESVDQVYQLLLEIARSSLSDIPRIPENITQKSLPLLQKLQSIQQRPQGQAFKSDSFSVNDLEWVAQVRQLLEELTRQSLSERPKMPENMAGRALTLADKAQSIKETIEENAAPSPKDEDENSFQSPEALLNLLHQSLKTQRAKSYQPDAPEWHQLLTMLDVVQSIYKQIQR
ncbi:MAG: inorganic pyrophosphatase [Microcoleus sp. PH2017_10_PVI_O_A]|uniref:inorganic pyrophosphatase n=1 Tax=unclassified Microcoleus TaxID=2642155 RepID=UPI001DAA603C|nr:MULTISPECIES: inorganic pyrophosphatase [unclassified Microcoleus]TAE85128.1 MAG: inorganic pyrophosphatase [Oscillatoriales cyanobacterium]MCC3405288.1 inorganic pyrophosphatase [Microcoleus sp. PH2017_10_PVI_O_A]MCC3458862.1 inorganic pyrophosphatase [Microcoleus sp. PH2017_11_PCY_U_A]MCC3477093.1 inorganic pyrophosphatase [Microcoleus sp. PH2017_12_PCY_D_A]MCC3528296.1 inorganic pyrophosphatase [Microcoleus sp. PH2017_21_RUC_O_A]